MTYSDFDLMQMNPTELEQQVRDCLSHLYDYTFLREHPLVQMVVPDTSGANQVQMERLTGTSAPAVDDSGADASTISVESEVQRAHSQGDSKSVDLKALLEGAISATHSLAVHHGVSISLDSCDSVPISGHSSGVLRQAILLITSQLIVHFSRGGKLTIRCAAQPNAFGISFVLDGDLAQGDGLEAGFAQQRSLHTLVETLEGSLAVEAESGRAARVRLDIPLKERTVLLVDDNPGMIDLFQRYLAGQTYRVLSAREGDEAVQIARQMHPDVVVLDVMLPGKDGWEVLQNLKTHPATSDIPVLICSVLDAFDLAISLGANACLKKPPNQAEFLAALARWPD
jgi:CheY-like chemotaxis protein